MSDSERAGYLMHLLSSWKFSLSRKDGTFFLEVFTLDGVRSGSGKDLIEVLENFFKGYDHQA
jgi:hypothetical protein